MNKRFLTLVLAVLIAALATVPAALAVDDSTMSSAGDYYVYTENGLGLNVRDTPGGVVVGSLPYGTKVYCYYNQDGWALIDYKYNKPGYGYGTYACFVSSRYLQKKRPPAKPSKTTPEPEAADPLQALNTEFASARSVAIPYRIYVRPTRASGWVNLYWAPSTEAELMATYPANTPLLVLKELSNWYQVEDQGTGDVGFINKAFVAQ